MPLDSNGVIPSYSDDPAGFYIGFFIAFAVKLPIIPLHTWLPDTHGEAHYSTCMLLAGILLKMGAYGLVRINMELFPHAHSIFSPWLIIIGATQIIYAASTSLGQRNLKKRIAYSSVSHMGFIIIGIGSITDMGLNGALLQIISHGFIGAALFFLAGTTYDRIRLVYLDEMGGIAIPMPKIFTMFSSFSMASLALPGMSGFVAELIVFFGLITSQKYLLMTKALITFVMAIGMILTPIYLLSMLRQMFYGYKIFNISNSYFSDSGPRELFLLISIFLPILGIGMYPDFLLSLSVEKVNWREPANYYNTKSNQIIEQDLLSNSQQIGIHLSTDFFLPFELISMVFSESLCKELQKKFFQQKCELGRIGRRNMNRRLNLSIPQNNTFLLPRDILAAADHLIGLKFGMGTLDDMNHLKNKRIRSVADLLQDQFGLSLVRLENVVRGTICGAIRHKLIPTPQNLVTSTPLTTTFESFFGLHPLSQVLDRTNPLTQIVHRFLPFCFDFDLEGQQNKKRKISLNFFLFILFLLPKKRI
ncbi:hypothetical protein CASFOL_007965 [Castilleja foliolosa]|uniref:NADH-plastoquinone oxidoreductase subunit 4 n=1 Tax=Castilleja foliolosa TaxID=1961234 RepID=A0ABD3E353_9LAMI